MKLIQRLVRDDSGASAAEYALILAVVGSGIALSSQLLGVVVASSMNEAGNCVATKGSNCPR